MSSEPLAVVFGLASAATWGASDFSGGIATKRTPVLTVVIVSQLMGGILLLVLALILAEVIPSRNALLLGGIAGMSGAFGLIALYSGLARGRMGVVSPVAAVTTAVLPLGVGIFTEGLPPAPQLAGFGIAMIGIWFLSRGGSDAPIRVRELSLPLAAGVGFGAFFTLIGRVSHDGIMWPLVAARIASISMLGVVCAIRRQSVLPTRNQLPIIALTGIFDTGGNAFYALATQAGRLDIATVLASLYPAGTVLLACLIQKERLERQQWIGVIATLAALALIAL